MSEAGRELLRVMVGFARALRDEGVRTGTGDAGTFCAAMGPLDPTDLTDLYWGGRVTLVSRAEDLAVYDRVFRAYFLGDRDPVEELVTITAREGAETDAVLEVPATESGDEEPEDDQTVLGLLASNTETLRRKSFDACSADELAALRRIMTRIRLSPPRRVTRRHRPARRGRAPDVRATVRRSLRAYGDPVPLSRRRRRTRYRPMVLVLDVSGSMADHSRALLQFAHTAHRASAALFRVEVFCFGTRLTHLTPALRTRRPDDALARAAEQVVDWEGGTRIGASLSDFVRRFGRRGVARGAVVVICSDGLDRGDPDELASAMERLSRLCHRVVWLNPHHGEDGRPTSVGMMVAAPHVDVVLSGHDLHSLERFACRLPDLV